jgi:hypothetical protein
VHGGGAYAHQYGAPGLGTPSRLNQIARAADAVYAHAPGVTAPGLEHCVDHHRNRYRRQDGVFHLYCWWQENLSRDHQHCRVTSGSGIHTSSIRREEISRSGRVLETGEERDRLADPRKQIAPGAPPILAFRYFLGADRHRFGKLEVMLDDAGH